MYETNINAADFNIIRLYYVLMFPVWKCYCHDGIREVITKVHPLKSLSELSKVHENSLWGQ